MLSLFSKIRVFLKKFGCPFPASLPVPKKAQQHLNVREKTSLILPAVCMAWLPILLTLIPFKSSLSWAFSSSFGIRHFPRNIFLSPNSEDKDKNHSFAEKPWSKHTRFPDTACIGTCCLHCQEGVQLCQALCQTWFATWVMWILPKWNNDTLFSSFRLINIFPLRSQARSCRK